MDFKQIDQRKQSYLYGEVNKNYIVRYNYATVDWVSATTTLTIEPPTGKKILITRIGFVAYNPATDFTQTLKIELYKDSAWVELHEATGFAPLIIAANRIESFKIGNYDMVSIHWHFKNAIRLIPGEIIRFTCSDVITGSDKFYAGATVVEYSG